MASFSLEEFVGRGALGDVLAVLLEQGWDDVPTLKMMSAEDMDALNLTQRQRDALEIRSYLHDRSLMEYAERLEASGKGIPELLNESPAALSAQYGMKRGHVARFVDRASACGIVMPPNLTLPARRRRMSSQSSSSSSSSSSSMAHQHQHHDINPPESMAMHRTHTMGSTASPAARSPLPHLAAADSMRSFNGLDRATSAPAQFKGTVAAVPQEPRMCGLVSPPAVAQDVAPLSVLEKIFVERVTPEYRVGADPWASANNDHQPSALRLPPPMKASDIWLSKPTLVFCIRRPGCVMCRAEAHQLYSRKPIFDALGIQLVAVLNEFIDTEVRSFWPRFWGGMIMVDKNRDFFKALGGGVLPKESFITGFIFNRVALANYKRAKATGFDATLVGEGTIKGGLLIVRPGKGGVAYQFVERNFGDWAPIEEVLEICSKIQLAHNMDKIEEESMDYFRGK